MGAQAPLGPESEAKAKSDEKIKEMLHNRRTTSSAGRCIPECWVELEYNSDDNAGSQPCSLGTNFALGESKHHLLATVK